MGTREKILNFMKEKDIGVTSREIAGFLDIDTCECEKILDKMYWSNKIFPKFLEGKKYWFVEC